MMYLAGMDFDFKELYARHSNEALLDILATPTSYQSGALIAARVILASRGFDPDELLANRSALVQGREVPPLAKHVNELPNSVFDDDDKRTDSSLWTNIVAAVAAVMTGFSILAFIRLLKLDIEMGSSFSLRSFLYSLINLVEFAGAILLFRRKAWGWYLLTAAFVYRLLFITLVIFFIIKSDAPAMTYGLLRNVFQLIVNGGCLYLLFMPSVKMDLSITLNARKYAVAAGIVWGVAMNIEYFSHLF